MGRLDGKVALVTGGGRGIGRGIVLEFAREGADVAINYRRDRDAADATAREVEALGRRAVAVQADVGDREAVDRMVGEVRATFGRIDIGVANSGVASRVSAVHEMEPGEWRRVLATDLMSVAVAILVVRILVEERFLRCTLQGGDYAARVRYRLIPFLW